MTSKEPVVTEVASGVFRYGSRYINCYLIADGGRLTLLDTGLPRYIGKLRSVLAHLGKSIRDVDAILLTHCHVDHIGSAKQVQFESTGLVFVHEADAPVVRGERKQPIPNVAKNLGRPFFLRYFFGHLAPQGGARYPHVVDLSTFADGDVLDVPGAPRVVHAPGHTAGSSALLIEEREVLFSGDALVTLDTWTGATGPHVFTPPFTEDYPEALRSLDRLEGLPAEVVLPGHGDPWTGGVQEAVAVARARARS